MMVSRYDNREKMTQIIEVFTQEIAESNLARRAYYFLSILRRSERESSRKCREIKRGAVGAIYDKVGFVVVCAAHCCSCICRCHSTYSVHSLHKECPAHGCCHRPSIRIYPMFCFPGGNRHQRASTSSGGVSLGGSGGSFSPACVSVIVACGTPCPGTSCGVLAIRSR